MQFFTAAAALLSVAIAGVKAQDNNDMSICDKYTTAALKNNTAANQKMLLTAVVNTALVGNFSALSTVSPPGFAPILADDSPIAKYFDGSLATTNRGGMPTKVNFLDGGGAPPLKNYSAATDMTSNQYFLLTHLYQYFGALLGCSMQSNDTKAAFSTYQGDGSMSKVHRFMNLTAEENNYFILAVGNAAASFGVTSDDITTVANTLNTTFNRACEPPTSIAGSAKVSQSICLAPSCPQAENANCTAGVNSFPNAAAAAVNNTAGNSDDNANDNDNDNDNSSNTAGGNGGSTGGKGGNDTDAASTNMASIAIGSTLGLGALVVATLF